MAERITYRQLSQILLDLGFVERSVPGSHAGYRHESTETLIMLAPHAPDELARPIDVKYIRRVLDENGLMDGKDFDRRISAALASQMA